MNKRINTLEDALTYLLAGLLYAERKVTEEFNACSHQVHSAEVKNVLEKYIGNAGNVTLKIDRIFNYLMREPVPRKNEVINKMLDETRYLLTYTDSPHLKEILMIECVKNVNAYKTATLKTCYLMAIELDLDTAADQLQQLLEWELATCKLLATVSIQEFNKIETPANVK